MSVCALSCVWLCDPMHYTCQAPLSMGFPRKEYCSGLPFPSPGVLPNSRIKPTSLGSPALAGGLFTTTLPGKFQYRKYTANNIDNIILILQIAGIKEVINELTPSLLQDSKYTSESESEVTQSCPTLFDPMDCSPPESSVHGIFQARLLEWVAISFSRRSSQPRDWTQVSHIVGRRFIVWATRVSSNPRLTDYLKRRPWDNGNF